MVVECVQATPDLELDISPFPAVRVSRVQGQGTEQGSKPTLLSNRCVGGEK